ncbi:MAG TPA: NAD(P)/FAD-dependent oxidoreductase [Reyranella sp.]
MTEHVVIVGAGFGGLMAAKTLARAPVRITLIDRRNHHLFQPLLYQVATAGLAPAQIAAPIRAVFRKQQNVTVLLGEVTGVDLDRQEVAIGHKREAFDHLVIATGAHHSYFGHDDWAPFAPGLKSLEDAIEIRQRILFAFELAETETDQAERHRLLTFVVIGAGPTGVEMAGAIAEISRRTLRQEFRNFDPADARVVLADAGPRVLPSFPESLSQDAKRRLEKLGVEVHLASAVIACSDEGVVIGKTEIAARTVIWAAGVAASSAAQWLGAEADRAGRVQVGPDLSLPGHRNIFVIGDTADAKDAHGKPLPGLAPVAKQQGAYVARVIAARIAGRPAPAPFTYTSFGNLATIGRKAAVIDFGRLRLTGLPAWLLWCVAHIFFLIGFRNRITVALDWAWAYVNFAHGSRLIIRPVGRDPSDGERTSNSTNAGGGHDGSPA